MMMMATILAIMVAGVVAVITNRSVDDVKEMLLTKDMRHIQLEHTERSWIKVLQSLKNITEAFRQQSHCIGD